MCDASPSPETLRHGRTSVRWGDTRPDGLPGLTPPPATHVRSEGPVRPRQAGKGRGRAVNPANSSCRKGCAARRRVSSRRSASKSPPGEAGHRRQRPVHPSRHFGMTISAVVVASSRTSVPGFGLGHIGTEPPRDHWVWGCPGGGGASPSPRKARGGQKRGARQNLCLHLPASGLGHALCPPALGLGLEMTAVAPLTQARARGLRRLRGSPGSPACQLHIEGPAHLPTHMSQFLIVNPSFS